MAQKKPTKPTLSQRYHELQIQCDTYHQLYDEQVRANEKLQYQAECRDHDVEELRKKVLDRENQYQGMLNDRTKARNEIDELKKELREVRGRLEQQQLRNTDLTGDLQRALGYIDRILEGEETEGKEKGKRGPTLSYDRNAIRHDQYL